MTTDKHVELVYHGPHASVEIDAPDGGLIVVKRGEKFAAPERLADGLLAQSDNYERAHAPKAKSEAKPTPDHTTEAKPTPDQTTEATPTPDQTNDPAPDAGDNKE